MKTFSKLPLFVLGLFVFSVPLFFVGSILAEGNLGETLEFTQEITEGDPLNLDYPVEDVAFGTVEGSSDNQYSTAVLADESDPEDEKINVSSGQNVDWTLSLDAIGAEWEGDETEFTYPYVHKLEVGEIEVEGEGVTAEGISTFDEEGSVTLAGYDGTSPGNWDVYNVDLTQEISGGTPVDSYSLEMALTLIGE